MSAIVKFNNLDLEISEYRDTWSLSDRQVAQAYGVTQEAVRKQRTQGATEYVEGVHYYLKDVYHDGKGGVIDAPCSNPHGGVDTPPDLSGVYPTPQKMVFWTKKGVITLGFKLTETPQTISFRDWASDFILSAKATSIQDVLADPRAAADILLRLADTQDEVKRLECKIKDDEPYAEYGRAVEVGKGDIKIGEYAKTLCNASKGIDTGEIRLFALMRELGILRANNEPMQKYLSNGYFRYIPRPITKPNGEKIERFTPMITPKGQVRLAEKLIEAIKARGAPRIKS